MKYTKKETKGDIGMKRKIRKGVFETNSSSVHSLVMCSESDYDAWVNGDKIFDRWKGKLIDSDAIEKDEDGEFDYRYYTHEDFTDWEKLEYETFYEKFRTEKGDAVVAFGYYGHD